MKINRFFILILVLTSVKLYAQENPNQPFINEQRIIIQQDGGNTQRFSIEMNGDQVLINGVPADQFKDSGIFIQRNGKNLFSDNGSKQVTEKMDSVAFLGVVTTSNASGAEITSIEPNSPAENSALKKGDIIKSINGEPVTDQASLSKLIRAQKPHADIQITYLHEEEQKSLSLKLGLKKTIVKSVIFTDDDLNFITLRSGNQDKPKLGVRLEESDDKTGLRVIEVTEDAPASKAGIKLGDLITEIDASPVQDISDASRAFYNAYKKDSFNIKFLRKGKLMEKAVYIPRKPKTIDL